MGKTIHIDVNPVHAVEIDGALVARESFDYLIGSPPSWGAQAECDWGDPGWSFAVDKILRALGDERSRWVAFLAFDGDLDRLHDTLHAYLDRELSHGYAGPVSKAALALHLNRWQRGLTPS